MWQRDFIPNSLIKVLWQQGTNDPASVDVMKLQPRIDRTSGHYGHCCIVTRLTYYGDSETHLSDLSVITLPDNWHAALIKSDTQLSALPSIQYLFETQLLSICHSIIMSIIENATVQTSTQLQLTKTRLL